MSARLATERETDLAIAVGAADEDARRECHDQTADADRRRHDRTNCSLSHLDYSLRQVDRDDLETYLLREDKWTLREYLRAVADVEYEKRERWPA